MKFQIRRIIIFVKFQGNWWQFLLSQLKVNIYFFNEASVSISKGKFLRCFAAFLDGELWSDIKQQKLRLQKRIPAPNTNPRTL